MDKSLKNKTDTFEFNEASHTYKLDGRRMTGVTTILGIIAKPALVPWAAKMTTEWIKENCTWTQDEPRNKVWSVTEEDLDNAKKAHRVKKESAGDIGTLIHDAIEQWVKNGTEPALGERGMKMFEAFRTWFTEGKYEVVASEKRLYSREHWYAGTVDLILKDPEGKHWIADIKTSSGVYPEYFAQMGGYHIAYEELEGDINVAGYIVIHLPKTGNKFEQYMFEDTQMCKDFFLHALGLYRIKNSINI